MDIDNKDIFYEDILQKLTRKEIKVGVIGMGYVGLPLSYLSVKKG